MLLVPPIAVVLSKQDLSKYDFSAMRLVECGSAPLGVEVEAIMHEKLGVPIKQVYGGSEVSCTFTAYWYDMEYKPGGVGLPLPNCEIKLVDPDTGALVGPDQPGEAWLKSPSVALGYFGLPEATKESFVDGWFRSGDILVYSSKDNIFRVTDRIKDLIKYNAFQIAPAELDDLLLTHPDIADVCVTGIPSEEHGEVPRAFVQLKPGVPATPAKAAEIIAFLDGKVTAYKRLRGGVEFRDVIPRGATGKLLRRQLRDEMKERMAKGGFKL